MEPRLKSSLAWTSLPTELNEQIKEVFEEKYEQFLSSKALVVESRMYDREVILRVGFLENGRLVQDNMEASIEFDPEKDKMRDQVDVLVDSLAYMTDQYIDFQKKKAADELPEMELIDFPLTWKGVDLFAKEVYLKYSTENSALENEADRLLGLSENKLFNEAPDEDTEDALDNSFIVQDGDVLEKVRQEMLLRNQKDCCKTNSCDA